MFAEIHKNREIELPFVLTTLGESVKQIPVHRPEGFNHHQFLWVKEGSGSFEIAGERFTLGVGEGVFMRANVPHSYEGKPFHTAWCTFTLSPKTLDYLGVGEYLRFNVPPYLDRETAHLMAHANGKSTLLSRSAAGYAYVTELFSTILSSADTLSTRVLQMLEQRYSEPLTLYDIADEFSVDRFTLCRTYKSERGVTVMDDLNRIRIAKAKRFLKYGTDPIEQVGRMCGFDSPSYFGKRFREAVGQTPAEYRKNAK